MKLLKELLLMVAVMATALSLNAQDQQLPGQKEYEAAVAALEANNVQDACKNFEKAIEKGHSEATILYAYQLAKGQYIPADPEKALSYCEIEASKGNENAALLYTNVCLDYRLSDYYDKAEKLLRDLIPGKTGIDLAKIDAYIGNIYYIKFDEQRAKDLMSIYKTPPCI